MGFDLVGLKKKPSRALGRIPLWRREMD